MQIYTVAVSIIYGNINTNFYDQCNAIYLVIFLCDVPFLKQTNSDQFYFGKMGA